VQLIFTPRKTTATETAQWDTDGKIMTQNGKREWNQNVESYSMGYSGAGPCPTATETLKSRDLTTRDHVVSTR